MRYLIIYKSHIYLGRRFSPAVCNMRPSASTTSRFMTFSLIVPYLTALVPDALVAAIPQSDASAPGSVKQLIKFNKTYPTSTLQLSNSSNQSINENDIVF